MKSLKYFFLAVDIGFIAYWAITALHLIPSQYLYNDYRNPILVHWNWSFLPLDSCISASGLYCVYLSRRTKAHWQPFALTSLVLTFASGLQAIAYWVLAHDYDLTWWLPNLFLLVYPLFFIPGIVRQLTFGAK